MSGWYPSDLSRPPYPGFEDDPRAEMEEERAAAFADWRRDRSADRVPGDDQDEAPIDLLAELRRALVVVR